MTPHFDYNKAKQDAEKILEVIERDPQAVNNWVTELTGLIPLMYTLAISSVVLGEVSKGLIKNNNA
jgi:hypothetical protein